MSSRFRSLGKQTNLTIILACLVDQILQQANEEMPLMPVARIFLPLLLTVVALRGDLAVASENDPKRPATAQTANVPVIEDGIVHEVLPYESIRSAEFAGWAPDGRGILIRTRFGNAAQLHRVYRAGGRREQMTFFGDPPRGRFVPASSTSDMLLTMSRSGDENNQLYLFQPRKFRTKLMTDGRSRHELGPVSPDGLRVVFSSNARNGVDMDLYVADTYESQSMRPFHEVDNEYWNACDWSIDHKRLLVRRYVSIVESYPAIYDFDESRLELLAPATDRSAAYENLRFSPDGRYVYLASNANGEFLQLAKLDLATGKYTWFTEDIPWDVESVEVDRETGRVAFTVNEVGYSRLYMLEPDGSRHRYEVVPGAIIRDVEFSPDGTRLGFTLRQSTSPAEAYSLELASGDVERWTYSAMGGLNPSSFAAPDSIEFPSFDGRQIPAFIYRPHKAKQERKLPVVLKMHGGPEGQYRPTFSPRIQFLIERCGCAVICPNVRGSTGYGKTYVALDDGHRREDSVRDVGALLDWIEQQPDLDAKRVTTIGHSYGGYMVLASLVRYGDRIHAGIESAGIANFATFLERTEDYRKQRRREEYGDERDPETRQFFDKINPASQAENIQAPLLVVHGENDPRVPVSEARQIVDQLESLNRHVWAVYLHDEGHQFSKQTNRIYLRAVELAFLRHHLRFN